MAIPKACKRLAEVDFPIAAAGSAVVSREKRFPVPRGLPSTLHQWWARRPLASSRAMLLALLLPDPCDPRCPDTFKTQAQAALLHLPGRPAYCWDTALRTAPGLRQALLTFIADFANWDNAANSAYLTAGRALVQAAHPEETPLVVDPFAGGGSIPLEALRLGCDAFASDLNPVSCLILKVMLEDIPRHGPGLADELRKAGAAVKARAERELADLYPKDPDGATPIAYLWARTVRCESPSCGAEIPLLRSLWLCRKPKRKWALRPSLIRDAGAPPKVAFEIFAPQADSEVAGGTVARARATCLCCQSVLPPERVRSQLAAQRGGADVIFDEQGHRIGGARMTAVVTLKSGQPGRHYRLATDADYAAVRRAQERITSILDAWERDGRQRLCPVPDEPTPAGGGSGAGRAFSVQRYGMLQWGDLFTARQKAATILSGRMIDDLWSSGQEDIAELMAMALDKVNDFNSSLSSWRATEDVSHVFGRQALPIIWDFVETDLSKTTYVGLERAINHVLKVVSHISATIKQWGIVQQADATNHPLPDQSAGPWFTDPPYYDAVPYADLSDFFLVWLKRTLPNHPLLRDPFDPDNLLSPKIGEVVQDETKQNEGRPKNQAWFEEAMAKAFAEGRRVLNEDGIGSVVFAHKTTEGWEALLSGLIRGGWTITGSWPIATEMTSRLRTRKSAALATSIHLVCRPRPTDAPVGDWSEVLRELPIRVGDWMERLQGEGIKGADLVFACVGPALEIFSRYARVETAAGDEVKLPAYLEKVWEVVGRAALEQVLGAAEAQARNGAVGALEEDARLTALFLWTLQSSDDHKTDLREHPADADDAAETDDGHAAARQKKGYTMPFDVTRRFAQPLGIHLVEWNSRIIDIDKGVVRLLPVSARGRQLFGAAGASALADEIETNATASPQLSLFPAPEPPAKPRARRGRKTTKGNPPGELTARRDATTLDRVHAAMLFQEAGRSHALRALIQAEQERGPEFLRLANALSALYPRASHEKRLLDAMLLAVPR